jgi:hypothetical protein
LISCAAVLALQGIPLLGTEQGTIRSEFRGPMCNACTHRQLLVLPRTSEPVDFAEISQRIPPTSLR